MSILEIILYIIIGGFTLFYVIKSIYEIIYRKKHPKEWEEKQLKKKQKKEKKENE